jgi:glycosyl transferase family 25
VHGLHGERVAAVDGKGRLIEDFPECKPEEFVRCHGSVPLATEIGAYLSHIKALQTFLNSGNRIGLILEDDASFAADFSDALKGILAHEADWDLMLLFGNHRGFPARLKRINEKYTICGLTFKQTGAVAYMVNRKSAEALLARLLPIRVPIDHAYTHPSYHPLRMRTCLPYPVPTTGSSGTTIGWKGKRRLTLGRRLTVSAYRAKQEMLRLFHYTVRDPLLHLSIADRFLGRKI